MKYFEVELSNNNTIDRSCGGDKSDRTILILGEREPESLEEMEKYIKQDVEPHEAECDIRKYVVSITEISMEEAYAYYNLEHIINPFVFKWQNEIEREMNQMTREKATGIVLECLKEMNPDMWNGNGSKPASFDNRAWQYPLTNEVNLEITFVNNEEDGWCHYCDLVYASDNTSFDVLSGYGIDSVQNIIDTVLDLCRDYEF